MPTWSALNVITGKLSEPDKMPCPSYSIPASTCKVGSRLRSVPGSTCSDCYACKGCYRFKSTELAMARRFERTFNPENRSKWVRAMAESILKNADVKRTGVFRWHDSGDLQNVAHLARICKVAELTPTVRHWLPTREYGYVRTYLKRAEFPSNLVVRLSAHMVNGVAPSIGDLPVSTVHTDPGHVPGAFICGAPSRDGHCGDCRACWDPKVARVSYLKH